MKIKEKFLIPLLLLTSIGATQLTFWTIDFFACRGNYNDLRPVVCPNLAPLNYQYGVRGSEIEVSFKTKELYDKYMSGAMSVSFDRDAKNPTGFISFEPK